MGGIQPTSISSSDTSDGDFFEQKDSPPPTEPHCAEINVSWVIAPPLKAATLKLIVGTWNIGGHSQKWTQTYLDALHNHQIAVCLMQETWLRTHECPIGFVHSGYQWYGKNRKHTHINACRGHGGLGVLIRKDLHPRTKYRNDLSPDMEDIMWIELQNKDGLHMFICNAYLGWENTDTAVPRALIRAEIERVYKELRHAHPDAMHMVGGDWNCLGLRRDIALEE